MKSWRVTLSLGTIMIAGFVALGMLILHQSGGMRQGGPSPEKLKELATDLESKGLWESAATTYTRYLNAAELSDMERASINYHLGTIYLDRLHSPDDALPHLIMARRLSGDQGIGTDADKRIVEALERLGRSLDASRYLSEAASIEPPDSSGAQGETVVARIGEREITLKNFEDEFQQMPPVLQEQMNSPERKLEFLHSMIVRELVLAAALRKGLDRDPEVKNIAERAREAAIIAFYQDREIERKIRITDADVRAYYEAHSGEFFLEGEEGKKIPLSYDQAKDEARKRLLNERRKILLDELLNRLQKAQKVEIFSDRLSAQ